MSVLSLLTDFGTQDGFIGVMKAVIWGICPAVNIADISHQIPPQNVMQAALTLSRVAPFFAEGTVHVAVVDPGVGTGRRAIAAQIGMQFCVAPDNGLLTLLIEDAEEKHLPIKLVELDNPDYWLDSPSHTFHGRDIFAPVGAHLAAGVPLDEVGTPISDVVRIPIPKPVWDGDILRGEIIQTDHFGNMASNIRAEHLEKMLSRAGEMRIRIGGIEIIGLVKTFGERSQGDFAALINSAGNLEIAIVNGDAAKALGRGLGSTLEVFV